METGLLEHHDPHEKLQPIVEPLSKIKMISKVVGKIFNSALQPFDKIMFNECKKNGLQEDLCMWNTM